jgi:sugar-specific transcriptional regulator TrmB
VIYYTDTKHRINKRGEAIRAMTEVIRNQKAVERLFIEMIRTAEQEILLIFPTANSFPLLSPK